MIFNNISFCQFERIVACKITVYSTSHTLHAVEVLEVMGDNTVAGLTESVESKVHTKW